MSDLPLVEISRSQSNDWYSIDRIDRTTIGLEDLHIFLDWVRLDSSALELFPDLFDRFDQLLNFD